MSSAKPDGPGPVLTPAEVQFDTSSKFTDKVPPGYTPWRIRNDYPPPKPADLVPEGPPAGTLDAPWLDVDPITHPERYLEIAKEHCFDGMIAVDFVPQKNRVRQWYHAPWMHYGASGREPLHGLTAERFTPAFELSATQKRVTQTWAVGFYNSIGASVFGGMWADPNDPDWTEDKHFPIGTIVFKLLFTNANNDELPILVGAPTWEGLIASQPANPKDHPKPADRDLKKPQSIRLLQVDIATRDDRAATGWVFGTFMYTNTSGKTGWDGLIPVGLQWGNDAELTQAAFEAGQTVKQSWINIKADDVRVSLHGGRPSFGWNGRLNGPADNFISACASCHSTAEWPPKVKMTQPNPIHKPDGKWIPVNDSKTMTWFQNIPSGTPITPTSVSADYSLQLLVGYQHFTEWLSKQPKVPGKGGDHAPLPPGESLPENPRQGPTIEYPEPTL
ncbi:hypothetical protein D9619_003440 [Psilocybe cf. subviscida]|uniref:Cytochrome c domain-containing protein n=1 Tax=Psilocybe cf. subviscida TaxID=2480587 RepID=A0A8H5EV41_9AGAR|nr:hypothetical protein D9619_003440 [Psilocybe cf. subviscida]